MAIENSWTGSVEYYFARAIVLGKTERDSTGKHNPLGKGGKIKNVLDKSLITKPMRYKSE